MNSEIIIYTDAGFSPIAKIASRACYIRHNDDIYISDGLLKRGCNNSTEAELQSIIYALKLCNRVIKPSENRIIIFSDSLTSIHFLEKKPKRTAKNEYLYKLADLAYQQISNYCTIDMRKVKAHDFNFNDERVYINHLVDELCTKHLRREMKKLC